ITHRKSTPASESSMGPSPKSSFQPSRTTFRCGPYSSTPQRLQSAASMVVTYQVPFELPNSQVPLSFRLSPRVVDALESLPPLPPASRGPPGAGATRTRSRRPQISPPDHRLAVISSIPPIPTGEVRQGLRQDGGPPVVGQSRDLVELRSLAVRAGVLVIVEGVDRLLRFYEADELLGPLVGQVQHVRKGALAPKSHHVEPFVQLNAKGIVFSDDDGGLGPGGEAAAQYRYRGLRLLRDGAAQVVCAGVGARGGSQVGVLEEKKASCFANACARLLGQHLYIGGDRGEVGVSGVADGLSDGRNRVRLRRRRLPEPQAVNEAVLGGVEGGGRLGGVG